MVFIFCVINYILTRKMPLVMPEKLKASEMVWRFAVSTKRASLALLLPILLLGSIYGASPPRRNRPAVAFFTSSWSAVT